MKITRTQKDAVISLLKEKYTEKEKQAVEKYEKAHKKEIEEDKSYVEALRNEYEQIVNRIQQINEELKNLSSIKCTPLNWSDVHGYNNEGKYVKTGIKIYGGEITIPQQLPTLKISEIERDLEIQTLSKDFDVEKFLKKYLEK